MIKGGRPMKDTTKKALQTVAKEVYKAVVEILIGVLLIYISRYI